MIDAHEPHHGPRVLRACMQSESSRGIPRHVTTLPAGQELCGGCHVRDSDAWLRVAPGRPLPAQHATARETPSRGAIRFCQVKTRGWRLCGVEGVEMHGGAWAGQGGCRGSANLRCDAAESGCLVQLEHTHTHACATSRNWRP